MASGQFRHLGEKDDDRGGETFPAGLVAFIVISLRVRIKEVMAARPGGSELLSDFSFGDFAECNFGRISFTSLLAFLLKEFTNLAWQSDGIAALPIVVSPQ